MARSVYSHVFLRNIVTTPARSTTAVPTGFVWVIRDIDGVAIGGTSAGSMNVSIGSSSILLTSFSVAASAGAVFTWRGRQVLVAGEFVTFSRNDALSTWHVNLSGYQLTLP